MVFVGGMGRCLRSAFLFIMSVISLVLFIAGAIVFAVPSLVVVMMIFAVFTVVCLTAIAISGVISGAAMLLAFATAPKVIVTLANSCVDALGNRGEDHAGR